MLKLQELSRVIADHAPSAIKNNEIKNYFGRKVAIDASMSLYQFLIAVRQNDGMQLTNESGETTSHLSGIFYRTIRMIENGIKPVYVFDGKPPELKSSELAKRLERRDEAQKNMEAAKEGGDVEQFDKFSRRTVKVTKEHNEECRKLLKLMGVPFLEAPCEAEAQCAALARAGKVCVLRHHHIGSFSLYASVFNSFAGSEDMDTLTFGAPVLLRHLTFSEQRKMPIVEIHLEKALEGLEMTRDQFIDLCILLGCDYCDSIRGIGPKKAVELIKEHQCIENVIKALEGTKYVVPENWPFEDARRLFHEPDVINPESVELKWESPDEEGLIEFLVKEKHFGEERIRKGIQRIIQSKGKSSQGRLDSFFFKSIPKDENNNKQGQTLKRKVKIITS